MQRRWLVIAVILTVAQACDNVTWGGVDVRLEGPPPRDSVNPVALEVVQPDPEVPLPELPDGPILLAGTRQGARATLSVVGAVEGDAVVGFPSDADEPGYRAHFADQLLSPGTEFVLFSEGVRVGRLVADAVGVDEGFCVARPTVTGTVELVPSAANASTFLALPAGQASGRSYEAHRALDHDYAQRVASIRLASEVIRQVGAPWPESVLENRGDIQAFRFQGADRPSIAATFVIQDRLRVEAARAGAYSVFFIGEAQDTTYQASYTWYRSAEADGKGAPRFLDHLDIDGDGASEVLVEVFGENSRWFASLARRGGAWTKVFEDSCGQGSSTRSP